MAFYKRSQLAKRLGKSNAFISMAVKREQLVMSGDFIDDELLINKNQIEIWEATLLKDSEKSNNDVKIEKPKTKRNSKGPNIKEPQAPSLSTAALLDIKKKEAEIELKIQQTETALLRNRKLRGESIPTELVGDLIRVLGQSLQTNYKNGMNHLMLELNHRAKIDRGIVSEFKGKMLDMINEFHQKAIDEAKESLIAIINNVSVIDAEDE